MVKSAFWPKTPKFSTDFTLQRFAQHGAVLQSARAGAGLQALAAVGWSWMIHILPNLLQQFHGKSDIRVYIYIYIYTLYILVHMIYKVTGWFGALGRVADSILMILFWWIENVVFVGVGNMSSPDTADFVTWMWIWWFRWGEMAIYSGFLSKTH